MNDNGDIDWETARTKSDVSQEHADQIYNACKDISKYNMNLTKAKIDFFIQTDICIVIS